jgi:hypothetical protein
MAKVLGIFEANRAPSFVPVARSTLHMAVAVALSELCV